MPTTATATGFLELNIAGFDKAISSAKKLLIGLGGAFAAFKTAQFWKDGIKDAIDFGNAAFHAGQKLGQMDPGNLLIAQKALENAGMGAEEARGQINLMVEAGRPLSQMFKSQGDFGKALANSSNDYGSMAAILSRSAEKFSYVFQTIASISEKVRTFFLAMTEQFVKPLGAALNILNEIDLAGMGAAFGKKITESVEILYGLFKNQKIGLALGLSLKIGFMDAIDWFATKWKELVSAFGNVDQLTKPLQKVMAGLSDIFISIGQRLAQAIVTAIAAAMSRMTIMGEKVFDEGQVGRMENEANFMKLRAEKNMELGISKLQQSGTGFGGFMGDFFQGLHTDTEAARAQLKSVLADALKTGEAAAEAVAGPQSKIQLQHAATGAMDPFKVIADSLARVGGGGGYMVEQQSPEAKAMVKIQLQIQETNRINNAIKDGVKKLGPVLMKK